jgi:hypothetical protein
LVVLVAVSVGACGREKEGGFSARSGSSAGSARTSEAAETSEADSGASSTSEAVPYEDLAPQGGTLRFFEPSRYDVSVVEGYRTTQAINDHAAPTGTEWVRLLFEVTVPERDIEQPDDSEWVIRYPNCEYVAPAEAECTEMTGGSYMMTAEQVYDDDPDVHMTAEETLRAGNRYYMWARQLVPKGVNLDDAVLCESYTADNAECVRVGPIPPE